MRMPISVKDYKWRETTNQVFITLPLKGVKPDKADIFTTNDYIKVNYPPFLFEVSLFDSVIEEKCKVVIGNGVIEFRLVKQDEGLWGKLTSSVTDKKEMLDKREEAVQAVHQKEKEREEKRARVKNEEKRFAVKEQMRIEQEEKDRIKQQKDEEIKKAMDELEIWKATNKSSKQTTSSSINTDIWTGKQLVQDSVPPPRTTGKISFQFTPRPFSTAARESKIDEEQEWLSKMAAARRIKRPAPNSEDQYDEEDTPNDLNPEFIKDKAIQLFKAGDNQGAINALSKAIRLNPNLPYLYANRAAVYLRMGDNEKTIQDCCRALELFFPVVPSNYQSRAKVFARRGTAYANIGDIDLALQDYSSAIKLSPDNTALQEDYQKLKDAT